MAVAFGQASEHRHELDQLAGRSEDDENHDDRRFAPASAASSNPRHIPRPCATAIDGRQSGDSPRLVGRPPVRDAHGSGAGRHGAKREGRSPPAAETDTAATNALTG